jgi:SAM-dependent methyltransferase
MMPQTHVPTVPDMDAVNRQAWQQPDTVRIYRRLQGYTDPGEQAAIDCVAQEARSRPLLDMGVGGGRTTPLLKAISTDYVGIDYTEAMVQACRRQHPDTRIEHMDARDLSRFTDGQFALAMFSFNGIDAIDYADRRTVLREVHRVLQDGGRFLFSAHNRHGPGHGELPRLTLEWSWNPLKLGWRGLKLARSLGPSWRNHRRNRKLGETHEAWSIQNCSAHDFGIVVMYTSLTEQVRQLQGAGFTVEQVLSSDTGRPVHDEESARSACWLHYVARKQKTPLSFE